jgi:hypothetical protein
MNMMLFLFRGNCILEIIIVYCGDMYFCYSIINMNQVQFHKYKLESNVPLHTYKKIYN